MRVGGERPLARALAHDNGGVPVSRQDETYTGPQLFPLQTEPRMVQPSQARHMHCQHSLDAVEGVTPCTATALVKLSYTFRAILSGSSGGWYCPMKHFALASLCEAACCSSTST